MEFITTQKNTRKLKILNFMFTKHRDGSDDVEIWRCEVRTCRKRVHTRNNRIVHENGEHNHAVVHGKAEVEETRALMRNNAATLEQPTRVVVNRALLNIPVELSNLIPGRDSLARGVRRHRQIARALANDLAPVGSTTDGSDFLRVDEDDLKIFASDVDLEFLSDCEHWFADGTFRVTPAGYAQVYTVHGFSHDRTFPCVYALLSGKTEEIYTDLFQRLLQLRNDLNPVSIMTDFELAAINAFKSTFPDVTVSGCMFHLGQCMWRRLQDLGMVARYNTEPEFALKVKIILALAFLPLDDVVIHFETLIADPAYRDLDPLILYFEDNFIGRQRGNRRLDPRFSIDLWNQYDRVLNQLPRSNNAVEGWHNSFNNCVDIAHPTVQNLAQKLQMEQHSMFIFRRQMNLGQPAPRKKKKYQLTNAALFTMVNDYRNRQPMQYLGDIARVLNINVV